MLLVLCLSVWYELIVGLSVWWLGVSDMVTLIIGFGWVDIIVAFSNGAGLVVGRGFVVGRVMTNLVGVGQSNTLA